MAESDLRQLESLQRTLVEAVRALQGDLAKSARTVEGLPDIIQKSFQGLSQKLQDQINFQGEMELVRTSAVLAGKQMLLDEELRFLDEKKGQLKQDVDRLMKNYVSRQQDYDNDAKQRVLKLDSHVNSILDFYCDNLMPLKIQQDDDLDRRLNMVGADVLSKRLQFTQGNLARQCQALLDFLNKRKVLSQQIRESQSSIKVPEKMEIYLPFFLVSRESSDSTSIQHYEICFPSALTRDEMDDRGIYLKVKARETFKASADLAFEKMKNEAIQKKIRLSPPQLFSSLKRGLAKLKARKYFGLVEESYFQDLKKHFDLD